MTPIVLEEATGRAEIVREGAELRFWSVRGMPLLWTPDPAIWTDVAPILFPIVGWPKDGGITVDGVRYPLDVHGFARAMTFDVLEQWPAHVRLGLRSDDATRARYPFDWSLEVEYALDGPALDIALTVRNLGERPMPYACGLHPGFRWPFVAGDLEDYWIQLGERERPQVPIVTKEGLFTRQSRPIPLDGRKLPLSAELFSGEALCFLEPRDRRIRFAHTSGAGIAVQLENFPYAALWSRPAGRFLSIEAWTSHGDYVDADGDLFAKEDMRHLPPGGSAVHKAKFSFVRPHLLFR